MAAKFIGKIAILLLSLYPAGVVLSASETAEPELHVDYRGGLLSVRAVEVHRSTLLQKVAEATGYEIKGITSRDSQHIDLTISDLSLSRALEKLAEPSIPLQFDSSFSAVAAGLLPQIWFLDKQLIHSAVPETEKVFVLPSFGRFSTEQKKAFIVNLVSSPFPHREDLLGTIARDPDPYIRNYALWALQRLGTEQAHVALQAGLGDDDYQVRTSTVRALGASPGKVAVPGLGQVLFSEPDPLVRLEAVYALAEIDNVAAATMLTIATEDNDSVVSEAAVDLLEQEWGSSQ